MTNRSPYRGDLGSPPKKEDQDPPFGREDGRTGRFLFLTSLYLTRFDFFLTGLLNTMPFRENNETVLANPEEPPGPMPGTQPEFTRNILCRCNGTEAIDHITVVCFCLRERHENPVRILHADKRDRDAVEITKSYRLPRACRTIWTVPRISAIGMAAASDCPGYGPRLIPYTVYPPG